MIPGIIYFAIFDRLQIFFTLFSTKYYNKAVDNYTFRNEKKINENTFRVGLPTFCFAIPRHLNTGASNLFKPRAILPHQKYWWAKQMKHLNFCPKIIVISKKKKKGPHLKSISDFIIFL